MAGVLGIYGLIIAVIISTNSKWHADSGCQACWRFGSMLALAVNHSHTGHQQCTLHLMQAAACSMLHLAPRPAHSPSPARSQHCPSGPHPCAVNQTADKAYYFFDGYAHFAAGLVRWLACWENLQVAGCYPACQPPAARRLQVVHALPMLNCAAPALPSPARLQPPSCLHSPFLQACGLAGLGAGMAIGIVGDAGVRANAQQPKLFVGMILILIFAEALALYGLIGESLPLWCCFLMLVVVAGGATLGLHRARQWCSFTHATPWLLATQMARCMPRACCLHVPHPRAPHSLRCAVGIILASKAGTAVPTST